VGRIGTVCEWFVWKHLLARHGRERPAVVHQSTSFHAVMVQLPFAAPVNCRFRIPCPVFGGARIAAVSLVKR
jgi:hypothetical protein